MKRNYENVDIKILLIQGDIVAGSPIDESKENIGEWNDNFLPGGRS